MPKPPERAWIAWLAGFVVLLVIGWAPMWVASASVDRSLHDTYYVVAQPHAAIPLGAPFLLFAAVYLWFVCIFGVQYKSRLAALHFGCAFMGALLVISPGLALSSLGKPARFEDYPATFTWLNAATTVGYLLMLGSLAAFGLVVAEARRRRRRAFGA